MPSNGELSALVQRAALDTDRYDHGDDRKGCGNGLKRWGQITAGLLALAVVVASVLCVRGGVIEIPLRMDTRYLKRLPGSMDFYLVGRLPHNGKLIAIPEGEIPRFLKLAQDEKFNELDPRDYGFMPPGTALSSVGKATIVIEETEDIAFWKDDEAVWITWDGDHPAPDASMDGLPIMVYVNPGLPRAPGSNHAEAGL